MSLKSSVVIFQALESLQLQWTQQPQQHRWPQWPQQPNFTKELPGPDGWIIPGTKMTSTGPFLWDGSSKIKFFTGIWYLFCWRLLRPAYVTFLKTGWKYQNVMTSECIITMKPSILIPVRAKLLYPFRYETPCIITYFNLKSTYGISTFLYTSYGFANWWK